MAKVWFATLQRYCFQIGMMELYITWEELTNAAFKFAAAELDIARLPGSQCCPQARDQIAFVSGNFFDVIGSKNFGFPTIWVRRYDQILDDLGLEPDLVVRDLKEMVDALGA